jgi:hypothetical protein
LLRDRQRAEHGAAIVELSVVSRHGRGSPHHQLVMVVPISAAQRVFLELRHFAGMKCHKSGIILTNNLYQPDLNKSLG